MQNTERFKKQLEFLIEIDKVKHILRKTRLFNNSRFENDAEHSWHLAIMALILGDYSNESIDTGKVVKMALIHDIVEIDSGDVIVYDSKGREVAYEKELLAAERIFGILPEDQKEEFIALWKEFEEKKTPEARFAAAIDRFEPIFQNHLTEYYAWKTHHITYTQLYENNKHIKEGSKTIWNFVKEIIEEAKDKGIVSIVQSNANEE